MTIPEVKRRVDSYNRCQKKKAKEKANLAYSEAVLIGVAVGQLFDSSNKFPSIEEAFPDLFEVEARQQQIDKNTNNFLAFAAKHNASLKDGGNN